MPLYELARVYYPSEPIIKDFVVPNGAVADQEITQTIKTRGKIHAILMDIPNFTNNITVELQFRNARSRTYFKSGEKARNQTGDNVLVLKVDEWIEGETTLIIEPSGDPGGTGGTVTVELHYLGRPVE